MTVIPAQGGLVDEGDNAVRLASYAQLQQYECSFWGVNNPNDPVSEGCSPIVMLPERALLARYLGEAQDEIEQVCGYPLAPRWFTDQLTYALTVHAKWKKIIEIGIEASSDISLGEPVSHVTDPAVIGPIVTTVTNETEVHVYHPGTDIEIDPSAIEIAAGQLTIWIPRCRMVEAASVNNDDEGLDYTDVPPSATSPFDATVDVKRIYNDPDTQGTLVWPHKADAGTTCTCGCDACDEYTHEACVYIRNAKTDALDVVYAHLVGSVWTASCPCYCSEPEYARVYYRAGLTTLTRQAEDAVIHLAHAKMPRPSCGCGILRDRWDADRLIPDNLTIEQANCPFGPQRGAWIAWRFANAMRSINAGIL